MSRDYDDSGRHARRTDTEGWEITTMDTPEPRLDWGLVPPQIVDVVQILAKKVDKDAAHLRKLVWPDRARDIQDLLRLSVSDSHKIARSGTDLRALMTAYAHQFHEPRPVMADIARAQDSSPQGIPKRYGTATVAGIRELLSDTPNTGVILAAFRSLSLNDLASVTGPVGEAAARQVAGDEPFVSQAAQLRVAQDLRRQERKVELSKLLPPLMRAEIPKAE